MTTTIRHAVACRIKRFGRFASIRDLLLFGLSKALHTFARPNKVRIVSLKLKSLEEPVLCRLGTSDVEVLREIFLDDEYAGIKMVPSVRSIVDLGSNIGLSIRYWAAHFPNAKLIGVEPDEGNFRLCEENCRIGKCSSRTKLFQAGIGVESGWGQLSQQGEPWTYRLTRESGAATCRVKVITMAEIIRDQGQIDILKCDIEGGEAELMAQCSDWIDNVSLIIMELHAPYSHSAFRRDLEKSGSRFSIITGHKGGALVICQRLH
jgi:FkbM family methyltransferase